jgi:hypothetical protein
MSNYKKIVESFNPYTKTNEGYFDKDTREKRKAERKEERSEKRFNSGGAEEDSLVTGKFKISAYIKAITSLKNEIIATLADVDQHIKTTPELEGSKEKFKKELIRAARVLGEISYLKTKEGNTLENDEDQELIKGYRDIYNSLKNDFEGDSETYRKERDELIIKSLKSLKFSEISEPIKQATVLFKEARDLLDIFNDNLSKGVIGNTTLGKDSGKKEELGKTGSSLKIKASIAKGAKKNDEVKAFQQLLIDKFSKNKDLIATATWKAFAKYGADGNFGNGTANVILLFKKLYKLEDKTSSITQELIDKISAEAVKESLLLSFNSFLNKQKGILEEFSAADIEAAETSVTKKAPVSSSSANIKKPASLQATPTGLDTEAGNLFRKWVNEERPEIAKKYDLDPTGPSDNTTIRKVWWELATSKDLVNFTKSLEDKIKKQIEVGNLDGKAISLLLDKMKAAKNKNGVVTLMKTTGSANDCIYYSFDKDNNTRFGHFYWNGNVSYKTSAGKEYWGKLDTKKYNVKFNNGKTHSLDSVVKMSIDDSLMGGINSEEAQKKDVYLAKGSEYVNVRSSTDTAASHLGGIDRGADNIIIKYKDKNKKIGFILSTKVVKSEKLGNKTWFKIQFPSEIDGNESGWVRSDTVDIR